MPRPRRRAPSASTPSTCETRSRQPRAGRSGWVGSASRRSSSSRKGSRWAPIGCWPSPNASWPRHRRPSGSWPGAWVATCQPRSKRSSNSIHRMRRSFPTAQQQVEELAAFVERQGLVSVPGGELPVVASTPPFYRWTFASLWAPGPFETKPLPTYYYLTRVDPAWPAAQQEDHLRDFHTGALWAISMHETYPGHFLHHQHVCRLESKVRKSSLLASIGFMEGWAHYSEQLVIEARVRQAGRPRPAGPARRGAHPPGPLRRRHPTARRGPVGGAGRAVLP